MSTPEAKVKKKVRAVLDAHEVYYFMPATGGYGRSGVPDIVGCCNGRFFSIECKANGNTTTALQDREIGKIRLSKGLAWVVGEEQLASFETAFTTWRNSL